MTALSASIPGGYNLPLAPFSLPGCMTDTSAASCSCLLSLPLMIPPPTPATPSGVARRGWEANSLVLGGQFSLAWVLNGSVLVGLDGAMVDATQTSPLGV